ncbi:hypothetical protein LTR29_016290 [Friedmanniomyces endolithicus]|nr:hypothetical protein LTR29_016290 [Friedmanniomyces endolithicus]
MSRLREVWLTLLSPTRQASKTAAINLAVPNGAFSNLATIMCQVCQLTLQMTPPVRASRHISAQRLHVDASSDVGSGIRANPRNSITTGLETLPDGETWCVWRLGYVAGIGTPLSTATML